VAEKVKTWFRGPCVMQYIAAGLVDEISIHLVPVLFGDGTRMFEGLPGGHLQLEPIDVVDTPAETHLRFRVAK
jgi:hypothetical protein